MSRLKNKKRAGLPRPNPYMLMTGAVAASAAALTMGGGDKAHAFDGPELWLPGVTLDGQGTGDWSNGGKMYDDIRSGQCATSDWVCYMTMTASIMTTGGNAVPASLHDNIATALGRWSTTAWGEGGTTLYYNLVSDSPSNDVRFKTADLEDPPSGGVTVADTYALNYHGLPCPDTTNESQAFNCEDSDQIPAHQPERWWYTFVRIDPNLALNPNLGEADQDAILTHELGHIVGLAHYPEMGCQVLREGIGSIMDVQCPRGSYQVPKPVDECAANHGANVFGASIPLLYGDGGPTTDPAYDPHAGVQCEVP